MRRPGGVISGETLSATGGVEETLVDAVEMLAGWDIPHLVAGCLAMKAHGVDRSTDNADLIVPDVDDTATFLTTDIFGPFVRHQGSRDTVCDERRGHVIHLLPAGQVLRVGCKVPFPVPVEVSPEPQFVSLEDLVSLKLDFLENCPSRRDREFEDIVELILRLRLPRSLDVADVVRAQYEAIWDGTRV
jgi:hypothetical protein